VTNIAHGITKEICEEVGDLESQKYGKSQNKNVLHRGLTTGLGCYHVTMIT
jgi:hypothetical protein